MQRNRDFSLFTISDVPYLLPFGQGIADQKRGVQVNATGAYLWTLLDRERTEAEMLSLCADHYQIPASRLPQLKADLQQFLHMLDGYGMLDRTGDSHSPSGCNAADTPAPASSADIQTIADIPSGKVPVCSSAADITTSAAPADVRAIAGIPSGKVPVCSSAADITTSAAPADVRAIAGIPSGKVPVCSSAADITTSAAPADVRAIAGIPSRMAPAYCSADTVCAEAVQRHLSIGGLTLLLWGHPGAFSRDFDAFEIFPGSGADVSNIDQTILVTDHAPARRPEGRILLQNPKLTVMESDLQYIFLFPDAPGIHEAHLAKDGTKVHYYCCPPYTENIRQDLFHAIRLSFLYLAQLHDMAALHSASLLYRGRAWLFSGHSGAGKSTHTNLWKELYNVPLINGDLNLLSMENGRPVVHGMPWCGTSGIADTLSYPLGGILLVKKAQKNCAGFPDDSHAQLLAAQRLISPNWTESMMQKNLCLIARLAPHILICRLHCTKTPEAAETAKQTIDDYLVQHCPNSHK